MGYRVQVKNKTDTQPHNGRTSRRGELIMRPKITKIEAFQVDLPLHEGSYKWSGGNSVEVFDSTVVAVHRDADRPWSHCWAYPT